MIWADYHQFRKSTHFSQDSSRTLSLETTITSVGRSLDTQKRQGWENVLLATRTDVEEQYSFQNGVAPPRAADGNWRDCWQGNCWAIFEQLLVNYWAIIGQLLGNLWATVGHQVARHTGRHRKLLARLVFYLHLKETLGCFHVRSHTESKLIIQSMEPNADTSSADRTIIVGE